MKKLILLLVSFCSAALPSFGSAVGAVPATGQPQHRPLGIITYSLPQQPVPLLTALLGSPSPQTITLVVSGSNLAGAIGVGAPAGFEVALASNGTYAASQTLVLQAGGFVNNQQVLIRLTGAALGNISGNISLSSPGSPAVDVPVTGFVAASANPPATLTSISPTTGMTGTTLVHFYGRDFVPGATATFYPFATGPTTFISSTHLTAEITIPGLNNPFSGYCGAYNPGPGGGGTTPPGVVLFTAVPGPPTVTGFTPAIGPVGTIVQINGVGFVDSGLNSVSFNGTPAQLFASPSFNRLVVRVPAGATTGPITVTTNGGSSTSTAFFVVPPSFFEDFETGTKTSYVPASIPLFTMGWTLGEALIGTTAGIDRFNGTRSVRLRGGGFVEMDVDKRDGAGVVTVNAATYATEIGASFIPEISTDGGVTYASLLGSSPAPTLTSTLTPYSFNANRTGNVRLRFSSTNTATATNPRINLDDISITDYRVGTATHPGQALPELAVFPNPAHGQLTVRGAGPGPVQVSLHDLTGRLVLPTTPLPSTQVLLLPPALPAGVYLLQVRTAFGQRTVRVATQ